MRACVDESVQILFHSLMQRNYTPPFLKHIKNTTLTDIKNRSRKEQAAKCQVKRGQACTVCVDLTPINNTKVTQRDKINNCGTSNVVYLITCNAGSVSYVGETGNQLRTRLNNHRSDIRHYNDTQWPDILTEPVTHMPICESQSWNQGHFLTTPHWKPSSDGTVNPNGLQDLKLGSQEV